VPERADRQGAPAGSHGRRPIQGSEAIEDYAKAIHALAGRSEGPVGTSALAERLGVSPGTVTAMLKRMAALGLVRHEPYHGVELTPEGERMALEVIRHHRLLEAFLAEQLGMPWDRVHDEAEVLEHYISEELEELIAAALGNPDRDPHGDPIPDRKLSIVPPTGVPLDEVEPGSTGVFSRVSDGRPEMLRFLDEHAIRPGVELRVVRREPFGGALVIDVEGEECPIGPDLAARMLIDVEVAA
jgi:DtxR family Mn-dependent transcriptional regulator